MTIFGKWLLVGMLVASSSYAVETPNADETARSEQTQVAEGSEVRPVVREIARRRRHRRHRRHHHRRAHRRHRRHHRWHS